MRRRGIYARIAAGTVRSLNFQRIEDVVLEKFLVVDAPACAYGCVGRPAGVFAERGESLAPDVYRCVITVVVGVGGLSQIGERTGIIRVARSADIGRGNVGHFLDLVVDEVVTGDVEIPVLLVLELNTCQRAYAVFAETPVEIDAADARPVQVENAASP